MVEESVIDGGGIMWFPRGKYGLIGLVRLFIALYMKTHKNTKKLKKTLHIKITNKFKKLQKGSCRLVKNVSIWSLVAGLQMFVNLSFEFVLCALKGQCHKILTLFYQKTSPGPHMNRQKRFSKIVCEKCVSM